MRVSFHGADRGVTGSCHLIECAGRRLLIDCGLFQGGRELHEEEVMRQFAALRHNTQVEMPKFNETFEL